MLSDAETFVRCQGIFDHTLFDRKLQDAAEFINIYTKEYSVLPEYEMVNASCQTELKKPESTKEGHMDWLMDEFESFIRHKALERAIINSADLLEKKDYGQVETLIKEAVQIGLAKDLGPITLKIRDRDYCGSKTRTVRSQQDGLASIADYSGA